MGRNPTVLASLAFVAADTLATLAVVGWRRRRNGVQTFAALMVAVTCRTLICAIRLGFTTAAEQLP